MTAWWRAQVLRPPADGAAARVLLADARERYRAVFELGTVASMLASALFDQVVALCQAASRPGLEQQLVTGYAGMLETTLVRDLWALSRSGVDGDPDGTERRQREQRSAAERELLPSAGRLRGPGTRLVLRIARAIIPQREIGKANYTQCLDGARLAARVLGSELAAAGRVDDPEDVFYLTVDELLDNVPAGGLQSLIKERRTVRRLRAW